MPFVIVNFYDPSLKKPTMFFELLPAGWINDDLLLYPPRAMPARQAIEDEAVPDESKWRKYKVQEILGYYGNKDTTRYFCN